MTSANGPIRASFDPDLRFELRPVVIPAAFEIQTESVTLWDQARTTRSLLQFSLPGEVKAVPTAEQVIDAEQMAPITLAKIEAISGEVVAAIEQIFQSVTNGGAS